MEKNEDILNKKEITEIKDPTTLISKIKGIKYKNKKNNKNYIGVIAQDIRNNIPEAFDNYNVDYTQLVALLIECIKKNNRDIKDLQQEVKNLKILLNQ
jgi:hypothetical protein|tara:strand:+ start:535 stop:828 length:294 start_codon:yes stop_codon:yes gene_type:complete